jgi:hypothetical protein
MKLWVCIYKLFCYVQRDRNELSTCGGVYVVCLVMVCMVWWLFDECDGNVELLKQKLFKNLGIMKWWGIKLEAKARHKPCFKKFMFQVYEVWYNYFVVGSW